MDRVKLTIDTLSSPAMHGRGYVYDGERIAAEYIKTRFEHIGLKSIKNSYFQEFTIDINTFPGKMKLRTNKSSFQPGEDYIMKSFSGGGRGRGRIKYLDTLIFEDESLMQQFLNENLKRRIFVYHSADYGRLIEEPEIIDKIHESKAVIELEENKLTMGLSSKQYSHPFFQLYKDSFDFNARRAVFNVDSKLKQDYKTQNVIGYVRGKSVPDSVVIICAHYDHLGRLGTDTYFPGANDNASGIAMLLELAHHYSLEENQPDYSIVFIAFGAEEAGLIGSRYFVENPLVPLKKIRFLINLDLLGTGDEGMMVVNGKIFQREFQLLQDINEQHNLLPVIKSRGEAANSDHYFFYVRGVPSFFFYTMGGIKAYHDVFDRAETLPLTRFQEIFVLIKEFIPSVIHLSTTD